MEQVNNSLEFSSPVKQALDSGRPVMALESTIITHGLPWPVNRETALALEAESRKYGVEPATIAMIDGRIQVGLDEAQLTALAQSGQQAQKASRRDLPYLAVAGETAGTTVAATVFIAALAGIRVFATGGIGGVHRGADSSMDISADLQELAECPVAVVSAGPKSILDIELTLEYLETCGVPVVGYRCDRVPAFYYPQSDFAVGARLDSAQVIAEALTLQWDLGMRSGAVIMNPIPASHALERETVEKAITQALKAARDQGVTGKSVTPFLLDTLKQLTEGESLQANQALVLNNAKLGAKIAQELHGLAQKE